MKGDRITNKITFFDSYRNNKERNDSFKLTGNRKIGICVTKCKQWTFLHTFICEFLIEVISANNSNTVFGDCLERVDIYYYVLYLYIKIACTQYGIKTISVRQQYITSTLFRRIVFRLSLYSMALLSIQ